MKYPQKQYAVVLEVLKQFAPYIDLKNCNPNGLHYLIYQQFSEGQMHNQIFCVGSDLKKYHQLTEQDKENGNSAKFIDITLDFDFELYPLGCNDNHIETAIKRAVKELTS